MTNLEAYDSIKEEAGGDIEQAKSVFRERYGYDIVKENLDEEIRITDAGPAPDAGPRPEAGPPPEAGPTPDAGPPLAGRPSAGPESILTEEDKAKLPKPRFKPISIDPVEDVIEPVAEFGAKVVGGAVGTVFPGIPIGIRLGDTINAGKKVKPLTAELKKINDKLASGVGYGKDEYYQMMKRGKELSAQIKEIEKGVKPDPIIDTYKHMAKTAKDRLGKDFYENWTASSAQVKESTIALLAQIADVEKKDETIAEGMKRAFFEGMDMPQQLVGGAMGMMAHTVANPIDTWRTQPAEVILVFAPFIPKLAGLARAGNTAAAAALTDLAGKPGVISGLKRMGAKGLNKAFEVIDKPLPAWKGRKPVKKVPVEEVRPGEFTGGTRPMTVGDVVAASAKGAVLGLLIDQETAGAILTPLVSTLRGYKPGLGTETVRRWLVDNAANSNPRLQALIRRVQFEPEIVAEEINAAGKRIGTEVKRHEKSPLTAVVNEMIKKDKEHSLSDAWQGIPQIVEMMDELGNNLPRNKYLLFLEDVVNDSLGKLANLRNNPDAAVTATGGKVAIKATDILLPELEAKLLEIRRRLEWSDDMGAERVFKEIVDDLKKADEQLDRALNPPTIEGHEQPVIVEGFDSRGEHSRSKTTKRQVAEEITPAVTELTKQIEAFLPPEANVKIRIAEALAEATVNNLADARVMKLVVKELVDAGVKKETAVRELKQLLEMHRKGEAIGGFGFQKPNGDWLDSVSIIHNAVVKVPEIREAILMETVGRISQEAAQATRRTLIEEKQGPYRGVDAQPASRGMSWLAEKLVQNDILGTDPLFSLPKDVSPIDIARHMDDGYIWKKARDIAGPELSAAEATRKLKNLRRRLERMKEHETGWLDGDAYRAIDWFDKAQTSLFGRDSLARKFDQWVKRHVTVGNAASAANNTIANIILQSIRRRMTIPEYVGRNAKIGKQWIDFLDDPGSLPPELSAKLRALQKTGEIGTDAVAIELAMTEGGAIPQSLAVHIPKKLRDWLANGTWNGKWAQKAYRYGDVLPKLEEGMFQLNRTIKDLNETLKPGESAQIRTGQGEVTTISRTESGWRVQGKDYSSLLDEGALDALAKAAMQSGRRLFFNYGDTGRLGKVLRSAPIIGIASPFYTWFSKAFFGPGGGLVGNVMKGTSQVIQNTDSAALNARLMKQGAADSLGRATLAQAQDIETRRAKDKLRKLLSWDPQLADAILLGQVSNPAFLQTKSIGSWSYDGPFNMGLRNAMGAWAWASPTAKTTAKELIDGAETPEDKRRMSLWMKQKAGERMNIGDMLEIVGLGGGPIVDAWETIRKDGEDKWGRVMSPERIVQVFGSALIGGTAAKQTQMVLDKAKEKGVLEGVPYKGAELEIEELKDTWPKYVIRKLLGLGLRPTLMVPAGKRKGAVENYLNSFKKKLTASLVGSYKKRIKNLALAGKKEEAKAFAADAAMWRAAINKEVGEVKAEIYEVFDLLKVLEKR